MTNTPPRAWRWWTASSLLILLAASWTTPAQAQDSPRRSRESAPAPIGRAALFDASLRRVQVSPGEEPAPPTVNPEAGSGFSEPSPSPTFNTEDLSLPAGERAFGGGEPTEEVAEEEAAEEESATPLMSFLGIEESPIKIYGWIQNSFTGNPSQPSDGVNFGVNPNNKANQWMGNQYYLIFEKPLEQNDEINFGFRVDNLFGNDWQFNKAYGLYDRAFNPGQFAGYDTAQMYAEVHLPILSEGGIDIKGGRWYTLHGYEVVPAIGRPLLSVPYMFNYGQPFTHFGWMSTWHATEKLNVYNGMINGWDRWIDEKYKYGYMGGFSWTFGEEDRGNLTFIFSSSPNQFPTNVRPNFPTLPTGIGPGNIGFGTNPLYNHNWRELWTTVLSWKWTDKLTQIMETDEAFERRVPGLGGMTPTGQYISQNAEWYSFGNWFLYDFFGTDKLVGVWRAEVFRDDDGARTGFADNFYEQTLGLIYKPCENLWIRPEARYDWAQFTHPYNGGVSGSQFTIGFDVILLY